MTPRGLHPLPAVSCYQAALAQPPAAATTSHRSWCWAIAGAILALTGSGFALVR